MPDKFKNTRGFTLMEMMTVIAIISIFSAMTVVNFRAQDKNRELKTNSLFLLDGIKKAQTMALSGEKIGESIPVSYDLLIPDISCSQNCRYELRARVDGDDELVETVNLGNKILLSSPDAANSLRIKFLPPRARMEFWPDGAVDPGLTDVKIKVEYDGLNDVSRELIINRFSGRMDLN